MIQWWRRRMRRLRLLREALWDACSCCARCHGHGNLYLPGGTVSCPLCGRWRRVLKETA